MIAAGPAAPAGGAPAALWEPVDAERLEQQHGASAVRCAMEIAASGLCVEPAVTADVLAAIPAGAHATGLEARLKGVESLARKVAGRISRGAEPEQAATEIFDAVRYTVVAAAPRELAGVVERHATTLRASGYEPVDADHSFVAGARYKGLHMTWRSPSGFGGGIQFEVQFHTPQSIAAKEPAHQLYEVTRDRRQSLVKRKRAAEQLRDLAAGIDDPPGLDGLGVQQLGVELVIKQR